MNQQQVIEVEQFDFISGKPIKISVNPPRTRARRVNFNTLTRPPRTKARERKENKIRTEKELMLFLAEVDGTTDSDPIPHYTDEDLAVFADKLFTYAVEGVLIRKTGRKTIQEHWAWILGSEECTPENPFPFAVCLKMHAEKNGDAVDQLTTISINKYRECLAGAAMRNGVYVPRFVKKFLWGDE